MGALVTGGCGFIGRFLVRELADATDPVRVLDRDHEPGLFGAYPNVEVVEMDIRNVGGRDRIFEDVDTVFHLAGLLGTSELYDRIVAAEEINVVGTLELLEAMRRCGTTDIVYVSKPDVWENSVYTLTKQQAERYVRMYGDVYGFTPRIVRPYNVYGPEQRTDVYRKAVPYFVTAALRDDPIEVFGSGTQTVDPIYVRECAEALVEVADSSQTAGETVELGTGDPITVNDLLATVLRLADSESAVEHVPMREGETPGTRVAADTAALHGLLEFEFDVSLETGLDRTIEFYRNESDRPKYTEVCELDRRGEKY